MQGVKEKLLNLVSVGKIEEFNRFLERNKSYHLNLSGINLARADLSDIYLVGVNLVSSDLSNAVIVHGNLSQANLSGANLSGAIIQGAVLQGADLRAAEKLPISKEHAQSLGAII